MVGVIGTWDILVHPIETIRCFGWRVFFKAVFSWHSKTFLSLLREADLFAAAGSTVPELFERCLGLELQAKRIYAALARVFAETEATRQFFEVLAQQEQEHADLLEICRVAARREGWRATHLSSWQHSLPRLEQQMQMIEDSLTRISSLQDALRLVIRIGSSEINELFLGIVTATDSGFIRKLRAFRDAMDVHIAYVCQRLPELAPELTTACRELRTTFSQG
jgi:hypothetical protein